MPLPYSFSPNTKAKSAEVMANLNFALNILPVGSIIPFYDFNAAVTFDTAHWIYCDGAVVSDAASPLNGLTLPDLSNRYLVGFGTEGGGDIDSASWATAAVGAASHQIDLSHTHTGPSHTHTGPSHTHSETVHSHPFTVPAAGQFTPASGVVAGQAGNFTTGNNGASNTGASGTGDTGASGTGATSSSLSATQSIQPRSIRVRFIMRKL